MTSYMAQYNLLKLDLVNSTNIYETETLTEKSDSLKLANDRWFEIEYGRKKYISRVEAVENEDRIVPARSHS